MSYWWAKGDCDWQISLEFTSLPKSIMPTGSPTLWLDAHVQEVLWDRDTHVRHWVDHPGLSSRSHGGMCDYKCDAHTSSRCLWLSTWQSLQPHQPCPAATMWQPTLDIPIIPYTLVSMLVLPLVMTPANLVKPCCNWTNLLHNAYFCRY